MNLKLVCSSKNTTLNKLSSALSVFLVVLGVLAILMQTGCASFKSKAKDVDTEMEKKQDAGGGAEVGVKDGKIVVQRKLLLGEELRKLQYEVYELEDRVYGNRKYGSKGLYGVLKDCRMQLSDPKNGGDGKLKWTEPIERVTDKEEDLQWGIDENEKLISLTEEYISDRVERFRGYKKVLSSRQDEYEEKLDICKAELTAQKSKVGTSTQ